VSPQCQLRRLSPSAAGCPHRLAEPAPSVQAALQLNPAENDSVVEIQKLLLYALDTSAIQA
jgi:hypothetical protein